MSKDSLAEQEAAVVSLMQDMQQEFKEMCEERQLIQAQRQKLEAVFPAIEKMSSSVEQMAAKIQLLMDAKEAGSADSPAITPQQQRPSVCGQSCTQEVDDCWERGSCPPTIGMEPNPRERNPKS